MRQAFPSVDFRGTVIWTRTNDPQRSPSHWMELVREGQYAVFFLNAETRVAEGDSLALCESKEEAVAFAKSEVAKQPNLCATIYDHEGKSKDPVQVIYDESVRDKYEGPRYAKRQAITGGVLLLIGIGFIAYDALRDFAWIWGYVIGFKLSLIGGFRCAQGLLHLRENKT